MEVTQTFICIGGEMVQLCPVQTTVKVGLKSRNKAEEQIGWSGEMSLAYRIGVEAKLPVMLSMKMNKVGPRTLPCGTPESTRIAVEGAPR